MSWVAGRNSLTSTSFSTIAAFMQVSLEHFLPPHIMGLFVQSWQCWFPGWKYSALIQFPFDLCCTSLTTPMTLDKFKNEFCKYNPRFLGRASTFTFDNSKWTWELGPYEPVSWKASLQLPQRKATGLGGKRSRFKHLLSTLDMISVREAIKKPENLGQLTQTCEHTHPPSQFHRLDMYREFTRIFLTQKGSNKW